MSRRRPGYAMISPSATVSPMWSANWTESTPPPHTHALGKRVRRPGARISCLSWTGGNSQCLPSEYPAARHIEDPPPLSHYGLPSRCRPSRHRRNEARLARTDWPGQAADQQRPPQYCVHGIVPGYVLAGGRPARLRASAPGQLMIATVCSRPLRDQCLEVSVFPVHSRASFQPFSGYNSQAD